MNPLNDQILQALPTSAPPQQKGEWDDFLPPVEGKVGDGFTARRAHGQHNGGDIHAAPGTPIVAPRDMVYLYGGKGGTNLRNNDYWAHFKDPETGKEYRFAHISGVPKLNPGDVVKQGEQWSAVGNVIDNPHVHMSVYNPKKGQSEDWPSALGLTQGRVAVASNPQLERKVNSVAATIPQQSEPQGESIAFDKGGKSYMDPSMLAAAGLGTSIPGLDVSDLRTGIDAGANTQTDFLGQVLGSLGSYKNPGLSLGGRLLDDLASTISDIFQGNRDKKLINQIMQNAGRHASWLQDISKNPPRPQWVDTVRGSSQMSGYGTQQGKYTTG